MYEHVETHYKTEVQITEVRSQGDYHKGIDTDLRFWVQGWIQMISRDLDMKVNGSGPIVDWKSGGMDKGMEGCMDEDMRMCACAGVQGSRQIKDQRSGGLDRGYGGPDVYTSPTAHLLPDVIPYEPLWDPREDHNSSPDDTDRPLSTCWVYGACLWFPLIPLNPTFDGPIFGWLNHSRFSLLMEVDSQGKHVLHHDIREKWVALEQKLLWCQEHLVTYRHEPCKKGRNEVVEHISMHVIAATRSWYIMTHRHHSSNCPWTAILTNGPKYPIPAEWVLELSRSFVGDLTIGVPRTGAFISSNQCPWQVQLPIFEKFSIPIWVCFSQNVSTVDSSLRHYIPSQGAITRATESVQRGQLDDSSWGQQDDSTWGQPVNNGQRTLGWDSSVLGWGQASGEQPISDIPEVHVNSLFPIPQPHSGRKQGEDWKAFFAWCCEENKKKEEKETPARRQSRQSRESAAMSHSIPGKSSTVVVF
ncbi:hypothetical protein DFJ58DRAFT_847796 [Suillus subalutaceus]|uniref:uncharacterized protein n=1 Tax=Suillus subalutaceus TaxID=48586 RepID=UPI001B86C3EC|nr:uncharacterized protein DFJ58DRAFT_847796 [Suillus subalutaceus]KAG1833610.1 hypothetical protein DFJ58DRAFT_847796 [Suillus subalutaceus]